MHIPCNSLNRRRSPGSEARFALPIAKLNIALMSKEQRKGHLKVTISSYQQSTSTRVPDHEFRNTQHRIIGKLALKSHRNVGNLCGDNLIGLCLYEHMNVKTLPSLKGFHCGWRDPAEKFALEKWHNKVMLKWVNQNQRNSWLGCDCSVVSIHVSLVSGQHQ